MEPRGKKGGVLCSIFFVAKNIKAGRIPNSIQAIPGPPEGVLTVRRGSEAQHRWLPVTCHQPRTLPVDPAPPPPPHARVGSDTATGNFPETRVSRSGLLGTRETELPESTH